MFWKLSRSLLRQSIFYGDVFAISFIVPKVFLPIKLTFFPPSRPAVALGDRRRAEKKSMYQNKLRIKISQVVTISAALASSLYTYLSEYDVRCGENAFTKVQ